jgi:hypothetical protein
VRISDAAEMGQPALSEKWRTVRKNTHADALDFRFAVNPKIKDPLQKVDFLGTGLCR